MPPGYNAKVISTVDPRSTGTPWHPAGKAIDVTIYDEKGRAIPNVGDRSVPGYDTYEKMGLAARQHAEKNYPNEKFTWGGHFNSGTPYDRMHFQSGGTSARNFTREQLATPVLPQGPNVPMRNLAVRRGEGADREAFSRESLANLKAEKSPAARLNLPEQARPSVRRYVAVRGVAKRGVVNVWLFLSALFVDTNWCTAER